MGADQCGVPGCDWRSNADSNANPSPNHYTNSYSRADSDANADGGDIRDNLLLLESSPWPSAKCHAYPDRDLVRLDAVRWRG